MTLAEENRIRLACGLELRKERVISEAEVFKRWCDSDDAGPWYEQYRGKNGNKL